MTLLKRVLAAVRSARPGATGQAVVTVTIQDFHAGGMPWRTVKFSGTVDDVMAAQAVYFRPDQSETPDHR